MRVRLSNNDIQELIYERTLPLDYKSETGFEERRFELDHRFGHATFKEQWFDGIHINEGKITMNEHIRMHMESTEPIIEMHFSLSGASMVSTEGMQSKLAFDARRHNIFYLPRFDGYMETGKQPEPNHAFEVHLSETYFKKIINSDCAILNNFAEKIEKQELAFMSKENLAITKQMDTLVHDIIHCTKQGALKRLFLESKILQLFILQVEQFESIKPNYKGIKHYDVQKLHHAKSLLDTNLSHPYSLMELSRLTGLNEFKLKKGFKELFGKTVFGYLHDLRMEEAKRLLLDLNTPIHAVAEYCGYQYVSHFTTAFRKKHGITPARFRA